MDVTSIRRMRIAIESPICAPLTNTGCVTSCPPRKRGVIMGPQHPGAVLALIVPPSANGPSIGSDGSSRLLVNRSTVTTIDGSDSERFSGFSVFSLLFVSVDLVAVGLMNRLLLSVTTTTLPLKRIDGKSLMQLTFL